MEDGGVDLYICGHEHVFQRHKPAKPEAVQHVCSGNSGSEKRDGTGLYKGIKEKQVVDWYDRTNTHGFVAYCVEGDTMTISFIDAVRCEAFETIVIRKSSRALATCQCTAGASSTCQCTAGASSTSVSTSVSTSLSTSVSTSASISASASSSSVFMAGSASSSLDDERFPTISQSVPKKQMLTPPQD